MDGQTIEIPRGEDSIGHCRVFNGDRVQISADAGTGATSLPVVADHPAIASGAKLLFGRHVVVTVTGACPPGDTTLPVTALLGPLRKDAHGQVIVDPTGYALEFGVFEDDDDEEADALVNVSASVVDDAEDPNSPKAKLVQIELAAADTADLAEPAYFFALWRTDSGNKKKLASGDFRPQPRAFL